MKSRKRRKILKNLYFALFKPSTEWSKKAAANLITSFARTKMLTGIYIGPTPGCNLKLFRKCRVIRELIIIREWQVWHINTTYQEILKECKKFSTKSMNFSQKLGFCHQTNLISNNNLLRKKLKLLLLSQWLHAKAEAFF